MKNTAIMTVNHEIYEEHGNNDNKKCYMPAAGAL